MGRGEVPGSDFPPKDPDPALPLASGTAGSGLRPAYDGGARRAPCPLCGLCVSMVDLYPGLLLGMSASTGEQDPNPREPSLR